MSEGNSWLFTQAAREGNLPELEKLLQTHPNAHKYNALFEAIKHEHPACVFRLLEACTDADKEHIFTEGSLLLYMAMETQSVDIFNAVSPLTDPHEWEDSVFYTAIGSSCPDFFAVVEPHLPPTLPRAVMRAVESGNCDVLGRVLEQYGLLNAVPLLRAARSPNAEALFEQLLPYATPANLIIAVDECLTLNTPSVMQQIVNALPRETFVKESFVLRALRAEQFETADILFPKIEHPEHLEQLDIESLSASAQEWWRARLARQLNERLHQSLGHQAGGDTARRKM